MDYTRHIQILYGLISILLLVVVGMGMYGHYLPESRPVSSAGQGMLAPTASSTQQDLSKVVVGGAGAVMPSVQGTITALGGNAMKLKDASTGAVDAIAISADTVFQIGGKVKDLATQQRELVAYNAQVATLIKDPVKNKEALAALRLPSTNIFTPAKLTDFSVGDSIFVTASSVDSSGTYVATVITKNPAQQ